MIVPIIDLINTVAKQTGYSMAYNMVYGFCDDIELISERMSLKNRNKFYKKVKDNIDVEMCKKELKELYEREKRLEIKEQNYFY